MGFNKRIFRLHSDSSSREEHMASGFCSVYVERNNMEITERDNTIGKW